MEVITVNCGGIKYVKKNLKHGNVSGIVLFIINRKYLVDCRIDDKFKMTNQ